MDSSTRKVIENKVFFQTITDTLSDKASVSFIVKGKSMMPFLHDQETEVFCKKKNRYQVNDICLFNIKDQYFLHRLIKIKGDQYFFRGDHLYTYEIVGEDQILAYVYQFQHKDKMIICKNRIYRFKVFIYLKFKAIKMFLRHIYRGVFHGRQ